MSIFKKNDLKRNISAHNRVAKKYKRLHGEIYNNVEQSRLREDLQGAVSKITTENKVKKVLDFGCGAGNLTMHLVSLGCEVIASDVSQGFLDLVSSSSYGTCVDTLLLNGIDLSNIPDESLDMVATYSVLHHIPDYIGILKEFMRVLRPGGIVYIDHEPSIGYWKGNPSYLSFQIEMKKHVKLNLRKYFRINNYIDWFIRKFINHRFRREGDIHVFPDDHIEWGNVVTELVKHGGKVILEKKYLLFRQNYNEAIYNAYKDKLSDMHVLAVKKK